MCGDEPAVSVPIVHLTDLGPRRHRDRCRSVISMLGRIWYPAVIPREIGTLAVTRSSKGVQARCASACDELSVGGSRRSLCRLTSNNITASRAVSKQTQLPDWSSPEYAYQVRAAPSLLHVVARASAQQVFDPAPPVSALLSCRCAVPTCVKMLSGCTGNSCQNCSYMGQSGSIYQVMVADDGHPKLGKPVTGFDPYAYELGVRLWRLNTSFNKAYKHR